MGVGDMTGVVLRNLGGQLGFGETALSRGDDLVQAIDASGLFAGGLRVFGTLYSGAQIRVATNGMVVFGQDFGALPSVDNASAMVDAIAPFWSDVDTRLDGEGAESGQIWVDLDTGAHALTVTWADVGSYRRLADVTNLFQLRLTDRGAGDFDIRFTYERIGWTQGTAETDIGARAMLLGTRLPEPVVIGGAAGSLHERIGNTGQVGVWEFEMRDGTVGGAATVSGQALAGTGEAEVLTGGVADDLMRGGGGNDVLRGDRGGDWLYGGDGADTLNAASGDDVIAGGETKEDLRDVIYGGDGRDRIDAGHGNDQIYGGPGDDTIEGGFGVDEIIGQGGNDQLSGGAWSDLIYGGDGADFLNGGFGFDRLNGGAGADRFFHLGIPDHGSDWVQDYSAAEGDVLVWGGGAAHPANFQVNLADTAGAGAAGVAEAFVIYRPTGQIIWALVDGDAQAQINLMIQGQSYDLL